MSITDRLARLMDEYERDIVRFVVKEFGIETLEPYQVEALRAFADPRYKRRKVCLLSSAGTGKTASTAWAAWWFLLVKGRPGVFPKGVGLSMTRDNFYDGFWKEATRWLRKSPILSEMFDMNQKRMFAKKFPELWGLSARTYDKKGGREEAGRVLSGLHGEALLYIVDESGAIVPEVGKAIDQGLGEKQAMFVRLMTSGNPMSKDSMLYATSEEAKKCGNKRVWAMSVTSDPDDPMRTSRVDKEWAAAEIKKYGRSDPWVKVFILGEFPDVALMALLDESEVEEAMGRSVVEDMEREMKIGVDVARFGADANVWMPRRGLKVYNYETVRDARTSDLMNRTLTVMNRHGEGQVYVDGTGGYGAGLVDMLLEAGYIVHEVNFGAGADNEEKFFNKRSEMWFRMAEAVKRGAGIPYCSELKKELCAPMYGYDNKGRFQLEGKEQIRKRLGYSPDRADALALTYAFADSKVIEMVADEKEPVREGFGQDIYDYGLGGESWYG